MMTRAENPIRERDSILVPALFLALAVLFNGLFWIHVLPHGAGPDEVNHLRMVSFIADHGRLPVLDKDIRLDPLPVIPDPYVTHPPGGYVVSAWVSEVFAGQRPEVPLRYGSLLCVLLTIVPALCTARLLFPGSAAMQIGIAAAVTLVPQVTFVSAYANNDAFGVLAGALLTWALVAGVCCGWSIGRATLFGLAAGLVLLSRYNAYVLLPVFATTFLISAALDVRAKRATWTRGVVAPLGIALFAAAITAGPWIAFNLRHYGEPLPLRTLAAAQAAVHGGVPYPTRRDAGFDHLSLLLRSDWAGSTYRSFFGLFGGMNLPLPGGVYLLLYALGAAAGIGLLLCAILIRTDGSSRSLRVAAAFPEAHPRTPLLLHTFAVSAVALLFLSLHLSLTRDYQAQGRYLFPHLVGIVVLLAVGLRMLLHLVIGIRSAVVAPAALATFMAVLNLYSSVAIVGPYSIPTSPDSLMPALRTFHATTEVHPVRLRLGRGYVDGMFVHSGHEVSVETTVRGPRIVLRLGLMPPAGQYSDGVRCLVVVDDGSGPRTVLDQTLRPADLALEKTLHGFPAFTADLSAYAGRNVRITLKTEPAGNSAYDWAVFLDPRWSS